jgi:hypothetical protein
MQELTTITPQDIDISKPAEFATRVNQVIAIQQLLESFWATVNSQMQERGISKLSGDWGSLSYAERKNWKVDVNKISDYYLKPTADTKKLNAAFAANELPEGADFTTTVYLMKRLQEAK